MKRTTIILIFIVFLVGIFCSAFIYFSTSPVAPTIPYYGENAINQRIIKKNGLYLIEYNFPDHSRPILNYVGNSKIDLEPFVNRYDVNISAIYPTEPSDIGLFERREQCIQNDCTKFFNDISGTALVIDILNIHLQ